MVTELEFKIVMAIAAVIAFGVVVWWRQEPQFRARFEREFAKTEQDGREVRYA
jgi:hypothetical protein